MLRPILIEFAQKDLAAGLMFSEINEAMDRHLGFLLMRNMPLVALRFSDKERTWSLVDKKGAALLTKSYDSITSNSIFDHKNNLELSVISGDLVHASRELDLINVQVFAYDHNSKERAHFLFEVRRGHAQKKTGVIPSTDVQFLVGDKLKDPYLAAIPFNFTPTTFLTTYFVEHIRSAKLTTNNSLYAILL